MPRPPIIEQLNWREIFSAGQTFSNWIKNAESPQQASAIERNLSELNLPLNARDFLAKLNRNIHVVAIAEDWCGDVVRHVPALEKMVQATDKLLTRYVARQAVPEVFVRYLTNGGEAIPKFIFLNDSFIECANWGAMPERCRELIARGKACGDVPAARKKISELYRQDAQLHEVFRELLHCLDIASSSQVE